MQERLGPDTGLAAVYRPELVSCGGGPFESLNHQVGQSGNCGRRCSPGVSTPGASIFGIEREN